LPPAVRPAAGADVADPRAGPCAGDADPKSLLGDLDEARRIARNPPDRDGDRRVGVPAVDDRAGVDPHDVPLGELAPGRGDAVDDLLVYRRADGRGIRRRAVPEK